MKFPGSGKMAGHCTAFAWLLLAAAPLAAQEVGLAGILGSKAMLIINGGSPRAATVGQTLDGVRLLAVQDEQVIVEIGGRKRALRVGQHAVGAAAEGGGKIVLTADGQGHFLANGTINGTSVRFLVDTGATMISLGASDARRIGLDFNSGQRGISQTANGQVQVSRVKLDTVRIGEVTLHGVDATIHQNDLPIALLGMSFLNRMEMLRDGPTMTLKKRY
ncbi:TIGR02281 family clan AA aspartic protease [Dechloromonas sp. ZY10]|uniref:retropepsin-like aspartic protease family protein n=1 Tax=Dechloromonas aquae TaxID=2664436 RepID=UPI003528B880